MTRASRLSYAFQVASVILLVPDYNGLTFSPNYLGMILFSFRSEEQLDPLLNTKAYVFATLPREVPLVDSYGLLGSVLYKVPLVGSYGVLGSVLCIIQLITTWHHWYLASKKFIE